MQRMRLRPQCPALLGRQRFVRGIFHLTSVF
jgi:hypothetical protein